MGKIKPCPFCGYDGPLDIWIGDNDYNGVPICLICPECGARGPEAYVDQELVGDLLDRVDLIAGLTRWNIRAGQGGEND